MASSQHIPSMSVSSNPIDRTLWLPNNGDLYPWISTSRMRCFRHVEVPDQVIVKSNGKPYRSETTVAQRQAPVPPDLCMQNGVYRTCQSTRSNISRSDGRGIK